MRELSGRLDALVCQFFEAAGLAIRNLDRTDLLTLDSGFRFELNHPASRFSTDGHSACELTCDAKRLFLCLCL
jgi:hypothetical protein